MGHFHTCAQNHGQFPLVWLSVIQVQANESYVIIKITLNLFCYILQKANSSQIWVLNQQQVSGNGHLTVDRHVPMKPYLKLTIQLDHFFNSFGITDPLWELMKAMGSPQKTSWVVFLYLREFRLNALKFIHDISWDPRPCVKKFLIYNR